MSQGTDERKILVMLVAYARCTKNVSNMRLYLL